MKFIPSFNSLRFFGALSVILLHLGSLEWFQKYGIENLHVLVSGSTGVALFYVLSGFLLTSIAIHEVRTTGKFSFKRFFSKRALRLFPLYYLAVLIVGVLTLIGIADASKTSLLFAGFYITNFVPQSKDNGLLSSFHTLATEEHFYIIFGLLFFIFAKISSKLVWFLIPALFILAILFLDDLRPIFSNLESDFFVGRWTPFSISPILIGCLGAFLFNSDPVGKFIQSVEAHDSGKLIMGTVLLLIFGFCYLSQVFWNEGISQPHPLTISIGFVALFWFLSLRPNSLVTRALSNKIFVYLGTISYGLYIWQSVINGTGSGSRWIQSPILSTILIFLAAILSYEFLEKPILKWRDSRSKRTDNKEGR